MVDRDLILLKADSLKRYVERVQIKSDIDLEVFLENLDFQESVMFNLQQAVQMCIDIAAHIVSSEGYGVPGSTSEMFYLLEDNGLIEKALTEKIILAIGTRNLIAHEYEKVDLERIYKTSRENLPDLMAFLQAIFKKLGISS